MGDWIDPADEGLIISKEELSQSMSLHIFLQPFTFLFHFHFLPSIQLPHVCFAFHMLMSHDKTMQHDDIGTDGLVIQDGLQCYCYCTWLSSFHFTILHSTQHLKCFLTPIHSPLSTHRYVQHFTVTMPIFLCLDQCHTFHSLCLSLFGSIPSTTPQTNTLANPCKEENPLSVPTYGRPGRRTKEEPCSTPTPPPHPTVPPRSEPTG